MTETKVPDIPDAPMARQLSYLNSNGFVKGILTQLNTQINTAIKKGASEVKLEWCITGAGIQDQYRETSNLIRNYYQDRGYEFESKEWAISRGYYKVWW